MWPWLQVLPVLHVAMVTGASRVTCGHGYSWFPYYMWPWLQLLPVLHVAMVTGASHVTLLQVVPVLHVAMVTVAPVLHVAIVTGAFRVTCYHCYRLFLCYMLPWLQVLSVLHVTIVTGCSCVTCCHGYRWFPCYMLPWLQVVPVLLHLITAISAIRLYFPQDLRPLDNRMSVLKSIQVCWSVSKWSGLVARYNFEVLMLAILLG